MKILTHKERIIDILDRYPHTRNSDIWLHQELLKSLGYNPLKISALGLYNLMIEGKIQTMEAAGRCRRLIQADPQYSHLIGDNRLERQSEQDAVKKELGYTPPVADGYGQVEMF